MKNDTYEDIINLPHHNSSIHPRMSIENRAAQFAPFSALTGYKEAIKETGRLTKVKIELDDESKMFLNEKLHIIMKNISLNSIVTFYYFVSDNKKAGGEYVSKVGIVKKVDMIEQLVILNDKTKIPINDIINIDSNLFKQYLD